jgi:hypothetical protein
LVLISLHKWGKLCYNTDLEEKSEKTHWKWSKS